MKTQSHGANAAANVTIGTSRQVVIPKKIHDELGLKPGDILEVELRDRRVVFTPKALVDKDIAEALVKALEDPEDSRTYGPFSSTKEFLKDLHARTKRVAR